MPKIDSDFKNLYYPLNELLEDMCNFLHHERLNILNDTDRNMADSIVTRSKKQLKALSKFKPMVQNNEEYVIMNKDEERASVVPNITFQQPQSQLYTDLAARDANKDVKFGNIFMKRKFLLSFEKMCRIYATIHMKYLLIYNSEKDTKPFMVLDLLYHESREVCERSSYFDVISYGFDSKTYHFQAPSYDEMLEWVTSINKCKLRIKFTPIRKEPEVFYDVIGSGNRPVGDTPSQTAEVIYEDLFKTSSSDNNNVIKVEVIAEPLPPLPKRCLTKPPLIPPASIRSLPLPHCPPQQNIDSLKYVDLDHGAYECGQKSVSLRLEDNNEEATYEEVVNVKKGPSSSKKGQDEKVISLMQTNIPVFPQRPKIAEKPPILKKPTNLRTARRIKLV